MQLEKPPPHSIIIDLIIVKSVAFQINTPALSIATMDSIALTATVCFSIA